MRGFIIESTKVLVVTAVALATVACSGDTKQLSKTDVQLAAGDLRTFAASTTMLIEQCSADRTTATFCREQADLLSSKVEDSISQLDGQAGDAEGEREQLAHGAEQLRDILHRIEGSSIATDDAAQARQLAANAKSTEDSLKK